MKRLSWLLLLPALAFGHDEGHGPKLQDEPKRGGVIVPVVLGKDHHGSLIYKAELVRSEAGAVRLYLYDKEMKPLSVDKFAKTARAVVETGRKGKWKRQPFELKLEDGVYIGSTPKPARKPFNIDVYLKEGKQDLLCSFAHLD